MRSDSTAHRHIMRSPLSRIRVPAGAQVQAYQLPGGGDPQRNQPPVITAAAQLLSQRTGDRSVKKPQTERWQNDAWDLRDEIGELRFIGDRQARGVSQVRLFVGKASGADASPIPTDDPLAVDLQTLLFGSKAATEQFLYRAAQHLIYNGESILHCKQDGGRIATYARSVQELQGRPGAWEFTDGFGEPEKVDDSTELVIRCWRPEPKFYGKADAPVRAVLPVARELRGLTMFVSAQIDSRLAGAGLLLVPDEIESMWARARAREAEEDGDDGDEPPMTFAEELTEYLLTPIKDRDSAASVVPFMASAPGELIDKVQHLTFASPLDEHAAELRDESIRRIGLGMDSDPSVLLGQATSNHWSGYLVGNTEIRFGVEPVASIICHSLTVGLLRPLLEQQGVSDVDEWQVWFDSTDLKVREDRSKDAQALYDKEMISAETLRAENGFEDSTAPNDDERRQRRLWDVLQLRPDLADKILPELGIDLGPLPAPGVPAQAAPGVPGLPGQSAPAVAPEAPNGPPVMGETQATEVP